MGFDELGLGPEVLKAVSDAGYTQPTPIQESAIPIVLQGRDVLGIAQTGTGKTASFTLPMIEILSRGRARARMPRTLILEPTRELATQVAENFETYGKYHKLNMALLIGGVAFGEQERLLERGVDVLIATPGRLLDHAERGKVLLTGVQILVIDEADRMLDMGFIPDIEEICKRLPMTRQTLFFSATMPQEIQRLTEKFLHLPERVEVAKPASAAATVTQRVVKCEPRAKRETLRRILRERDVENAIIFCNRKRDVGVLCRSLNSHGFSVGEIHGDLDQSTRTKTLEAFRAGDVSLLIASDVAARGLDIPSVGYVFNFDVPVHADDYVHRIGRTGRAGREGIAITLVTGDDGKHLAAIEKLIGGEIPVDESLATSDTDDEDDDPAPREDNRRRGGSSRGRGRNASSQKADDGDEAKADTTRANTSRGSDNRASDTRDPDNRGADNRGGDDKDRRRKRRGSGNSGNGGQVLGFGDHVPAFILQEVRVSKTSESSDDDIDDEIDDGEELKETLQAAEVTSTASKKRGTVDEDAPASAEPESGVTSADTDTLPARPTADKASTVKDDPAISEETVTETVSDDTAKAGEPAGDEEKATDAALHEDDPADDTAKHIQSGSS